MFTSIPAAIEEARTRRNDALQRHIDGKYWPIHFVVTQFRNRLEVRREYGAASQVLFTTKNDGLGTVNTGEVAT
ncbi:hypothetical protein [Serratia nevei]|uniref:hypothetical protein n=1 Tax=Serratia nevei TaxID=2703794 RepID=UPI003AF87D36